MVDPRLCGLWFQIQHFNCSSNGEMLGFASRPVRWGSSSPSIGTTLCFVAFLPHISHGGATGQLVTMWPDFLQKTQGDSGQDPRLCPDVPQFSQNIWSSGRYHDILQMRADGPEGEKAIGRKRERETWEQRMMSGKSAT